MVRILLAIALHLLIITAQAQIYKWTDSQGIVHFSDTPHPGAETVNNLNLQSYSSPPATHSESSSAMPAIAEQPKKQPIYTELAITQPENEATIRNNQGYVVVTVRVEPKLFTGHGVQIVFDGKPQGTPQDSLTFQLNGIYRGSHTLMAQIVDSNDDVVKTSAKVVIFMQRPRVGMVRNQAPL